mmetsp:Transcript_17162/g.31027  ORF Transcript_17162/g.31027 Transcript_17162/m.31027 type:complete len:214 (+) Transcript_17162:1243-1884(+)
MVPGNSLAPGSYPEPKVRRLFVNALGQGFDDGRAVDGHAHDIATHEANRNGPFGRGLFGQELEGLVQVAHEETVRRRQAHNIAPDFRALHNFSKLFGKPVVVTLCSRGFHRGNKSIDGRLVKLPHHFSRRDIPQGVMLPVVFGPQKLIGSLTNVTQTQRVVIVNLAIRRIIRPFILTQPKHPHVLANYRLDNSLFSLLLNDSSSCCGSSFSQI